MSPLRPIAARCATTAVAVVLACAQFVAALHFLLVPHAFCAEHGALVHLVGGEHHHQPPAPATVSPEPEGPALFDGAESGHGLTHEHCTLLSELRRRLCPRAPASFPAGQLAEIAAAVSLPDAQRPSALVPLTLAPKSSPPRG